MNKARNRAYRVLVSGCRYHTSRLSSLTIGQRRGSLKSLRDDFEELRRRIVIKTGCPRIEYFATYVFDQASEGMRRHAHIIWTSPITSWSVLMPMYEKIAKEQSSIWIDDQVEISPKKMTYCLQYTAKKQGESVRYAKSQEWVPLGYEAMWKEIKTKKGSDYATWIIEINNWLDRQPLPREKTTRTDTTRQSAITPLMVGVGSGARPLQGPFIKRALTQKKGIKQLYGAHRSMNI